MAFSTRDYDDWIPLDEGGEAEIFRARQVSLDRPVAVKRLKLALLGGEKEAQRFESGAKLGASLSHPGLVAVIDYGQEGRYYHLVMEYVRGVGLDRLVDGEMPLPFWLRCRFARQMAEALDYLHGRGILHRDLKPENYRLDFSGRVRLLDLGLARRSLQAVTDPQGRVIRGTLAYLPPELLSGGNGYERASEYYVQALVALELLTQRRMFQGDRPDAVLAAIQQGPPASVWDSIPPALAELLRPFFSPRPEERPPLLTGLIHALGEAEAAAPESEEGVRQSLSRFIRSREREWLWQESLACESQGRLEEAFRRTREILDLDAEDGEAAARLTALGVKINEGEADAEPPAAAPRSHWPMAAAVAGILTLAAAAVFLVSRSHPPPREDLGLSLAEKEKRLLGREGQAWGGGKPALRPYGTLILKGVPAGFLVKVNGKVQPAGRPLHLPEAGYAVEVTDSAGRRVLFDSVRVSAAEPAHFDFARKVSHGPRP